MATICKLCHSETDSVQHIAERWVIALVKKEHPEWVEADGACPRCIDYYLRFDDQIEEVDGPAADGSGPAV